MPTFVELKLIRTDGGTQARESLDPAVVAEYKAAYIENADGMPVIEVVHDGKSYWLWDGFHRLEAMRQAEMNGSLVNVRQGTQRDAILLSCGANNSHGKQRTAADKRRSITMLLMDVEWGKCSDRWIAAAVKVSHVTVASVRREVKFQVDICPPEAKRVGKDGKAQSATKERPRISGGGTFDVAEIETVQEWEKTTEAPAAPPPTTFDDDMDFGQPPPVVGPGQTTDLVEQAYIPFAQILNHLTAITKAVSALVDDPQVGQWLVGCQSGVKQYVDAIRSTINEHSPAVHCNKCHGKGCEACKQTGWLPKLVARKLKLLGDK